MSPERKRGYDDVLAHVGARRRKRRSLERRRGRRSMLATAALLTGVLFVTLLAAGAIAAAVAYHEITKGLNIDTMRENLPGVNTVIYDRYGHKLAVVPSIENRTPVTSRQISPWMKRATVAIEDRRFYQHGGVDYQGVIRALWENLKTGHVVQGASTLEQQLAKLLYLNDAQTFTRKIKEADLAMQIADQWSKSRILTTYLNVVPYGGVTYGCEAAAETYYSIHCKNLDIAQAALLAGLPQSPTDYNPNLHPIVARERRNEVLLAMYQNGDINLRQYQKAVKRGLDLKVSNPYADVQQPYFVQYVESLLRARYGEQALRQGGLRVRTTIDPRLQKAAHAALTSVLDQPGYPAGALVSLDPRTGEVLAFDASTNYRTTKYDLPAQAHRQAGSSFKPFGLLAAMIDEHIDPETTVYSTQSPFTYQFPDCYGYPSCTWTVNNAEGATTGNATLHQALDGSINAVFARLSIDIGAERTVNMAYRLGIPKSDHLPDVYSIILGTGLVSPLDMAGAYSTIADNGIRRRPLAITDVRSYDGKLNVRTPAAANDGVRVVPSWATYEVTQILKDNVTCAIGYCTGGAALLSPYRPEAGKTGTVESHYDAWFCGYTPNLVTCVWMGFPQSDTLSMIPAVGSAASFGGGFPTEIWQRFMTAAFAAEPHKFPPVDWTPTYPPAGYYQPFVSQFPTYTPPPPAPAPTPKKSSGGGNGGNKNGNGNGNGGGGGNGNGNGNGNGGGGGGGTTH